MICEKCTKICHTVAMSEGMALCFHCDHEVLIQELNETSHKSLLSIYI